MPAARADIRSRFSGNDAQESPQGAFNFPGWNATLQRIHTQLRIGGLDPTEKRGVLEALGQIESDLERSWRNLEQFGSARPLAQLPAPIGEIEKASENVLEQLVRMRVEITASVRASRHQEP